MTAERFYPLSTPQPYPLNQWWVAARSTEVNRSILVRTLLDTPVAFFRSTAGTPVAVRGICPHRLFPFSKGRLVGDTLECGYHGLRYDVQGRCVHIPTQPKVEGQLGVRCFPLREHGGLVWIWMGDKEPATATALPDIDGTGVGRSGWATEYHALVTAKARYVLLIENLMDLSHISFIHSETIPAGEAVVGLHFEICDTPASLLVRRAARGMPPNPFLRFLFPANELPVNQHFDAEYLGPGLIRTGGLIEAVSSDGTCRSLGITNYVHAITPETTHSVHYFVQTARNFRVDDPAIAGMNFEAGGKIQPQDVAVIEAIEPSAARFGDTRSEISCAADAGAIKVRRRLSLQIAQESDRTIGG